MVKRTAMLVSGIYFGLFATVASAQTVSYELNINGAASSVYPFAASVVTCNVTTLPGTGGTLNPRFIAWDDPDNTGRYCFHDTGNNSGVLFALPIGAYTSNLVKVHTLGSDVLRSAPSNTVNFSRLVPPVAVTGLRVRGAS